MTPLEGLITVLGSLGALNFIAWKWGVDTRESGMWRWRDGPESNRSASSASSSAAHR
jgi:hypothetical protein